MDNRKLAISLLNDLGFEHTIIAGSLIPPLGDIYHYWASAKIQKITPSEIIEPKTFKECYGRTKEEAEDRQYGKIIEWAKSQKGGV
ncbi:hypothetical protein BS057_RS19665 [Vibrio parahaemolyticus]|nr:hypothetical protein [Vibrio parahaemolyticus]